MKARRLSTVRASTPSLPRRLVFLLVIAERLLEPAQHFGGHVEHGLELRLVDLADVGPQVIHHLLQALLHLLRVMARIGCGLGGHGALSGLTRLRWVCLHRARGARGSHLRRPRPATVDLARYTHRVVISSSRLVAADETGVTFKCKDYRVEGPGRYKTMTVAPAEFIRRFMLHVLPKRAEDATAPA